jgi:hypothetical protein
VCVRARVKHVCVCVCVCVWRTCVCVCVCVCVPVYEKPLCVCVYVKNMMMCVCVCVEERVCTCCVKNVDGCACVWRMSSHNKQMQSASIHAPRLFVGNKNHDCNTGLQTRNKLFLQGMRREEENKQLSRRNGARDTAYAIFSNGVSGTLLGHQTWHTLFLSVIKKIIYPNCHRTVTYIHTYGICSIYLFFNCHLGWRTLVLKCNKNKYDWLLIFRLWLEIIFFTTLKNKVCHLWWLELWLAFIPLWSVSIQYWWYNM